jgi:hypothetical protein
MGDDGKMSHRCIEPDQAASVLELSVDDPRRIKAEQCPRCASLLLQYRKFMAGEAGEGADMEGAEKHLADFTAGMIRQRAAAGKAGSSRGHGGESRARSGRIRWLLAPRPMLAAAAAVILIAAAAAYIVRQDDTGGPVLRNAGTGNESLTGLEVDEPQYGEDGSITLSWHAVDGADSYVVSISTADLETTATFGPLAGNTFTIGPDSLPKGAGNVMWRVTALSGGDTVAKSAPAVLRLP